MIPLNKRIAKALISLFDVQAGLHLCCSQIPGDRFSRIEARRFISMIVHRVPKAYFIIIGDMWNSHSILHMGLIARKPVFRVCDSVRLKPTNPSLESGQLHVY